MEQNPSENERIIEIELERLRDFKNHPFKTAPTAEASDTIGIMLYAYAQVTREDSPVENVVWICPLLTRSVGIWAGIL